MEVLTILECSRFVFMASNISSYLEDFGFVYSFPNEFLPCFSLPVQELDHVVEELEKIAVVNLLQHRSIISLIGNVQRSSLILEKVLPY